MRQSENKDMLRITLAIIFLLGLTGCASLVSSSTERMASNITQAMLNQDDLETVKAGAPAYLLMIDGLIEGSPEDVSLLLAGSKLYSSYATTFVTDEARSRRLAAKSLSYAKRAMCQNNSPLCKGVDGRLDNLENVLAGTDLNDQKILYGYAVAWAGWIQANTSDWNAIAAIPKLVALLNRSIALNQTFDDGGAHLYLGVLTTLLPPSAGGKPEVGRKHFEHAQKLSDGNNLMVNVLFAKHYARLVFNQKLHDQLLKQVLSADIKKPSLTLINTLAKTRAKRLLAESSDYF